MNDQLAKPLTESKRRASRKALNQLHPGNRFRLMAGLPLLHEPSVKQPAAFEAHGHTWFRHTPGDPCPVEMTEDVCVYFDDQTSTIWPKPAMSWSWKKDNPSIITIIGWRRASMTAVPSECQPSVSSDRILSILIAAGHITEEQVEQARKLVKP